MEGVSAGAELGALATRHVSHPPTPRSTRNGVSAESACPNGVWARGENHLINVVVQVQSAHDSLLLLFDRTRLPASIFVSRIEIESVCPNAVPSDREPPSWIGSYQALASNTGVDSWTPRQAEVAMPSAGSVCDPETSLSIERDVPTWITPGALCAIRFQPAKQNRYGDCNALKHATRPRSPARPTPFE